MKIMYLAVMSAAAAMLTGHPAKAGENRPVSGAAIVGSLSGSLCKVGFFSDTNPVVPPDDTTDDNPAIASLSLSKNCKGPIVAIITGEAFGKIHLDATATCEATGGFTNPCVLGTVVRNTYGTTGSTAHYFFSLTGDTSVGVSATAQFEFRGLRPGVWRVDVRAGNSDLPNSSVGRRFMTAFAYRNP